MQHTVGRLVVIYYLPLFNSLTPGIFWQMPTFITAGYGGHKHQYVKHMAFLYSDTKLYFLWYQLLKIQSLIKNNIPANYF